MVVEVLTVEVDPAERSGWLQADETVWTRHLRTCDGFVAKERWLDPERPGEVTVVIWWASREQWKAITADEVAAVDARMGEWRREPRCREYRVLGARAQA